ncbi:hypothetical protein ACA910_001904 [Epithemia clementina (nom. ined.)]
MLLNQKKRVLLRQDIIQRYPFVPQSLVDASLDLVATGLGKVSPLQLQQALQPGGMAKVRPELRQSLVTLALQQELIQRVPLLSSVDKTKVLGAVVDAVLDRLLEEVDWIFLPPTERLQALHDEIQIICATEMTPRQVAWFYVTQRRQHPITYVTWTLAALVTISSVYYALQSLVVVSLPFLQQSIQPWAMNLWITMQKTKVWQGLVSLFA